MLSLLRVGVIGVIVTLVLVALGLDGSQNAKAIVPVRAIVAAELDRGATLPVAEDPYEIFPELRYKLPPGIPTVTAKAGAPGSGLISVDWEEGWQGLGVFSGFVITGIGQDVTLGPTALQTTFQGLGAGSYSVTVTAIGQYANSSSKPTLVTLFPKPPPPPPVHYTPIRNRLVSDDGTLNVGIYYYRDCTGQTLMGFAGAYMDTCVNHPYFLGHRWGPFAPFGHFKVGTGISWYTSDGVRHHYRIISVRLMTPSQSIMQAGQPLGQIQFQTCNNLSGTMVLVFDANSG